MNNDSLPTSVVDFDKRYLFVRVQVVVEDRRPDLSEEEARLTLGYKYKTMITVWFFGRPKFYYISRSVWEPYFRRV
jgi:hypothetical protein